jgi:hypothetical protein
MFTYRAPNPYTKSQGFVLSLFSSISGVVLPAQWRESQTLSEAFVKR